MWTPRSKVGALNTRNYPPTQRHPELSIRTACLDYSYIASGLIGLDAVIVGSVQQFCWVFHIYVAVSVTFVLLCDEDRHGIELTVHPVSFVNTSGVQCSVSQTNLQPCHAYLHGFKQ